MTDPKSSSASSRPGAWEPPSPEALQAMLPQYEIVSMLGRGGMGAVYKGVQKTLDRPVAIKILSTALEESEMGFAERFKNEARALGRLSHPGIVGVYDFGSAANGLLYIVMEFVDGTDVARMLAKKGRLPVDHAMAITAHVCDALGYAHERGIIHRDIKPANIMVGYDGVVRVADFGLAKMSHDGQSGLTQSGMAMGTLYYMAPEALMLGSSVDHRADIYAVGVMLYQMLAGKLPQGLFEMPSKLVEGLDPRYDAIISKAMREDREVRYQSILALRADLDHILTQPVIKVEAAAEHAPAALPTQARPQRTVPQRQPVPAPEFAPPPRRSASNTLVWAAVALLACVAVWLVVRRVNKPQSTSAPHVESPSHLDQRVASSSSEKTIISPSTQLLATASKEQPFINSLGMKFVPVPGTNVLFCVHETRYRDYATYAAENPGVDSSWKNQTHGGYAITERGEDHPATSITWNEAKAFCAWLSKKEGITYRLPQDREWSAAVGIGHLESWDAATTPASVSKDKKIFLWVNDQYPPPPGAGNFSDKSRKAKAPGEGEKTGYINGYDDGFPTTAPVMSFPPNPHGLFDLAGNVVEWCEDWLNSEHKFRVQRGLSSSAWWEGHIPELFLASTRTWFPAGSRRGSFGFRCVIELSKSSQTTVAEEKPSPSPSLSAASPTNKPTVLSPAQTALTQPPELIALEQQYRAAIDQQVTPAVNEYAQTLLASYRNALDRAARTPGVTGADATALRAETQRLATDPTVPDADPSGTPRVLTVLRNTFRQAVASFRSEKEAPLKTIYDVQVRELKIAELAGATKEKPFTNSLGMKFVRLPGTSTLMCIHETRRRDYAVFASNTPDVDKTWEKPRAYNGLMLPTDDDTHPASAISHVDAKAFCAWLSKHENRHYRLPTDHEWSIAAGIGDLEDAKASPTELNGKVLNRYPWGDYWPPLDGDGNYADKSWLARYPDAKDCIDTLDDKHLTSSPVMSYKPNALGIFDLGGNCAELTEDLLPNNRVAARGQSWLDGDQRKLLSSYRGFEDAVPKGFRPARIGFRCVLVMDDSSPPVSSVSGASQQPATVNQTPTAPPTPPTTPRVTRRGGVDRFDSARHSSGLVMFESNLKSQIMPAAGNSYTPLLLQELYKACVELEIEQCQKNTARTADLSWFQAELERVRSKSYPNGSTYPAQPDRLRKLREAYWQAAVEIDRRLDAQKK